MRKIKLYFVRHRAKVRDFKILLCGLMGIVSYVFNFHYDLLAPAALVLILVIISKV